MRVCQRIICYIFACVTIMILFSGCSENKQVKPSSDNVYLDTWLGDYEFYEFAPPDENMYYMINLYKENGEYYAEINIDGFQTNRRIKATVQSKKESIDIVFDAYLPDNDYEDLNKGDILLNFKQENSEILTNWGKIQPLLLENEVSGKVYFTKVKK